MALNNYLLFNSINIPDLPGVKITGIDYHQLARREVTRKRIPYRDTQKVTNAELATKLIPVRGTLSGSTIAEFEQRRDNLKRYILAIEATLITNEAGSYRSYTATVDQFIWSEKTAGLMGEFTINFVTSSPFGEATSYTTARTITGITASNSTNGIGTILGGYKTPSKITVTINTITDGTSKYFILTNPATGKYTKINTTVAAADVYVIDAAAMTVTKNGVAIDFVGVFLDFDPGAASIQWQDNFTARNVTVKVEYKQRDV